MHSDGLVVDGQNQVNQLTSWYRWYNCNVLTMMIYGRISKLHCGVLTLPTGARDYPSTILPPTIQLKSDCLSSKGRLMGQVDETTHLLELGSDEFWETGLTLGILKNEWVEVRLFSKHRKRLNPDAAGLDCLHSSWFLSMIGTRMCIYIYVLYLYIHTVYVYILYRIIIYTVLR